MQMLRNARCFENGSREKGSLHKSVHDGLCVESLEVGVGLPGANENDGLSGDVSHRDGCADLKTQMNRD